MKNEFFYPSADGKTQIHATEWVPENVRCVLQIVHGMTEYLKRYEDFAEYLNENGILVVGEDHLGHGESVTSDENYGYFGRPDGFGYVISDIHKLREMTHEKYPDVPYFILGHSMGSFLTRRYLMQHGEGLSGAVIMGTGSQPKPVLSAGIFLTKLIALFKGWHHRSKLVQKIAFGAYNKKIENPKTSSDWLTKDEEIIREYRKDPRCTFIFTLDGFYNMFRGISYIQKKSNIAKIPKSLPIFFVAGKDDPVGSYGKGVTAVYEQYKAFGISDIDIKLYDNDRHEILNETDKETVYSDILDKINSICKR